MTRFTKEIIDTSMQTRENGLQQIEFLNRFAYCIEPFFQLCVAKIFKPPLTVKIPMGIQRISTNPAKK